jgi:hypothetical protein
MFGRFSKEDFIKWNPNVKSDCMGIDADQYLCVAIPGTQTTRTAAVPSTTADPSDMPTQSEIATNCSEFWFVSRSVITGLLMQRHLY